MINANAHYEVYKLSNPKAQVDMPSSHKWAVSRDGSFLEAFKTKKAAKAYLATKGACTLCGYTARPCECEQRFLRLFAGQTLGV